MKKWMKFLFLPLITLWILDFVVRGAVFYFFDIQTGMFSNLFAVAFVYFIFAAVVYETAPVRRKFLVSAIYVLTVWSTNLALGLYLHGHDTVFFGEVVTHRVWGWEELTRIVIAFISLGAARSNDLETSSGATAEAN